SLLPVQPQTPSSQTPDYRALEGIPPHIFRALPGLPHPTPPHLCLPPPPLMCMFCPAKHMSA
ncbi:Ankyrin-3, partial [Dissostichus eleginoides]